LSTEGQKQSRELIYQEYFSTRKTSFLLPEIVAQMEKAQDQVIRASYGGPLIVTGPAGSGKTTLALHRVAYLLQSPETADKISAGETIVFVQDESTRDYFSHLLPELGIKDVEITTLASWARKILSLDGWTIKEHEKDSETPYIWAKVKALKSEKKIVGRKDWFKVLTETYADYFNAPQKEKLIWQKNTKTLDRLDLAVLLKSTLEQESGLMLEKEYYTVINKNQEIKRHKGRFKASYKLMIIDEFQNYLPEQLALFNSAINTDGGEMVYIGDFNQRVRLGTISDINEIHDSLTEERLVKLLKVYRNTKEILVYLKNLGYEVTIPEMIKSGPEVQELILNESEELLHVENKLKNLNKVSVGILSHNEKLLEKYSEKFCDQKNVKIMSLIDAQGVEFDTVFLVGVDDSLLSVENLPAELQTEAGKIKKDLLYIALTRATNSLEVLGRKKLALI
jgi:DNA helicase IV